MCSPYCCSSYTPFFAQDTPIRPPIIYRTSSILLCSPLNYCYYQPVALTTHHHQDLCPFPPFICVHRSRTSLASSNSLSSLSTTTNNRDKDADGGLGGCDREGKRGHTTPRHTLMGEGIIHSEMNATSTTKTILINRFLSKLLCDVHDHYCL